MLMNIQIQSRAISYADYITQMFCFLLLIGLDNCLLVVRDYDCFVAIYHPLHYTVIMNRWLCVQLLLVCWTISLLHALLHSLMLLPLSFCTDIEIPHFFCELDQVVHRTCSDTFLNDLTIYGASVLMGCGFLARIQFSYSKIISTIPASSSAQGLGVYLSSATTHNSNSTAIASVMYTVVTPMLNPFIYSLRNEDIKRALGGTFRWKPSTGQVS
ncbi:olfactory receptor 7A17-like [Ochotona princeps]|uniref:olfactory receptor 7A17-like n=1 Tax=Ochotona princeps TaxID=9978 RepID=UPI002715359B|nr:olfactory receptor 7A17-like [Ochotona princeps]